MSWKILCNLIKFQILNLFESSFWLFKFLSIKWFQWKTISNCLIWKQLLWKWGIWALFKNEFWIFVGILGAENFLYFVLYFFVSTFSVPLLLRGSLKRVMSQNLTTIRFSRVHHLKNRKNITLTVLVLHWRRKYLNRDR